MISNNIRAKVIEICNYIDEINDILISSQQIHGVIKLNPDEENHLLSLVSSVNKKVSTLIDDTIIEEDFIQYIKMISEYMKSIEKNNIKNK